MAAVNGRQNEKGLTRHNVAHRWPTGVCESVHMCLLYVIRRMRGQWHRQMQCTLVHTFIDTHHHHLYTTMLVGCILRTGTYIIVALVA